MDVAQLLQSAVTSHQAGDLDQAGRLYASVLRHAPDSADAWHLSGVMALQLGRVSQAVEQIEFSLQLNPNLLDAWTNLAAAQLAAGEHAAAESSCRECLQRDARHSRGHMLLGNALKSQLRPHEALAHYKRALDRSPNDATIWCNYGVCLLSCGRLEPARDALQRAIRFAPDLIEAHVNLGVALRRLGNLPLAAQHLRGVLEKHPGNLEAQLNLANVLREQMLFSEAVQMAESVLQTAPDHAKAWNLLGLAKLDAESADAALPSLRRAAELAPDKFVNCLLYATSLSAQTSPQATAIEHRRWASQLPRPNQPLQLQVDRSADRPLKIGFMSGDFRTHAVAFFLLPWLTKLNRDQFDIHCFSESERVDRVTNQFREISDAWTNTCGLSDEALAGQIAAHRVDILVDLAGHTGRSRLSVMNWRPAPIQMTFLGYPNTTGLDSVDYFVTDELRDPPGAESLYCEELLRLEGGAICFEAPSRAPEVSPSPMVDSGRLTFGSLHRLSKLNDGVLSVWARLFNSFADARLLVVRDSLESPVLRTRLLDRLQRAGIDPQRVEIRWQWQSSYLEHYRDIDLLLPVFPWGGGTTTYEAMWMGVLPLTVRHGRPASQAAVAALQRVGLSQWLAESEEDLVRVCHRLVGDHDEANRLRGSIRDQMRSTVCDGDRLAREIGEAFRRCWRRWLAGASSPPDSPPVSTAASISSASTVRETSR